MPFTFGDLDPLDEYLGGGLTEAAQLLAEGKTARLFEKFRDDLAGRAGLKHEQTNGLLTPEAIADQSRREAVGREAAQRDATARAYQPSLEIAGQAPASHGGVTHSTAGCARGAHNFGSLRGANGEAECRDCGTVFICPP